MSWGAGVRGASVRIPNFLHVPLAGYVWPSGQTILKTVAINFSRQSSRVANVHSNSLKFILQKEYLFNVSAQCVHYINYG